MHIISCPFSFSRSRKRKKKEREGGRESELKREKQNCPCRLESVAQSASIKTIP